MGAVMKICTERRGLNPQFSYPAPGKMEITFEMPLAEVIYDFYDKLKTVTRGYGSFDYELIGYRESQLVKLDILVNGEKVDALAGIVHQDRARKLAVQLCERLKEEIPRHQFKIAIQGADRRQDHRPLDRLRLPKGRDRQALRRRRHPQTQAPGEAEEGQEAHEDGGLRHDSPAGLRGRVKIGQGLRKGIEHGAGGSVVIRYKLFVIWEICRHELP